MISKKILLLVLVSLFLVGCGSEGNSSGAAIIEDEVILETKSTGSTEMGDVMIELTPRPVDNGILNVDVRANTHSVSLNQFDLKEIVVLEYNGKEVKPTEVPSLSGHHASGTLSFNVGGNINGYKITIKGIPNVDERVYEWE